MVNIYPGLCNKNDWPACGTGTLLAQAVPADYAGDELLVNWTKPSYNPIMENTQRDPSTPYVILHLFVRFCLACFLTPFHRRQVEDALWRVAPAYLQLDRLRGSIRR